MTELLEITSRHTGTTVRLIASGEIDLATVSMLRRHASFHLAGRAEIVVLDLSAVSFIDSSGLQALLEAAENGGDRLRIIPSPPCLRLLDLAGVRGLLPLVDGDREASPSDLAAARGRALDRNDAENNVGPGHARSPSAPTKAPPGSRSLLPGPGGATRADVGAAAGRLLPSVHILRPERSLVDDVS
jgi:stage II sporulation protein AA (anti-sigma F factor antagonist)